jgi:hypothetical protein
MDELVLSVEGLGSFEVDGTVGVLGPPVQTNAAPSFLFISALQPLHFIIVSMGELASTVRLSASILSLPFSVSREGGLFVVYLDGRVIFGYEIDSFGLAIVVLIISIRAIG